MSRISKLKQNFSSIADAIRAKEHSYDTIHPLDFPQRIRNLQAGSSSGSIPPIVNPIDPDKLLQEFKGKTLEECSWADIQRIAKAGIAPEIFKVGDVSASVRINGSIGGTQCNFPVRFRIIDFNHNAELEGNNTISFLSATALTDNKYSNYVNSNDNGLCMNRKGQIGLDTPDSTLDTNAKTYGPNKGGWEKSYGRVKICDDYFNAMPEDLQAAIGLSTIYSDNVGNGTGDAKSNITATQDKVYFLSEIEVFGARSWCNQYTSEFQKQMQWFKNGNSAATSSCNATGAQAQTQCYWWEREPYYIRTYTFCFVYTGGSANDRNAAFSFGIRPAFKIS